VADQPLEDLLTRLERERLAADRLYNDALTAVDRAIQQPPDLPAPPSAYDDRLLAAVNDRWNLLPAGPPPVDRSLKGRLRGLVWRIVGPPLESQTRFNAALVEHLNRNAAGARELPLAVTALLNVVRGELAALARFQSLLVQYLQTITVYVDSKDRSLAGPELRQRLALAEQRLLAVQRRVERAAHAQGGEMAAIAPPAVDSAPFGGRFASVAYVEFEDRFRGARDDIRGRVDVYAELLSGSCDVLDVGCGRGELLEALGARGIAARGIDGNHAMVEQCRARGLAVEHADAVAYLERQPDGSLGGLVAVQVVEHFEPSYLLRFLDAAFRKMRSGGPLVLETINPACWMAFFETYLRDPTHVRPLYPDTLRFLVEAAGFSSVAVQFRQPVDERDRLPQVAAPVSAAPGFAELAATVNAHADKLNARLFSFMDYAVVARR
jgi:SAM-dependent methyltransferase